jgi:hypothetical protein
MITPYEANRSVVLAGVGIHPATTSSPTPRAPSPYLPTRCEPFFKARARSPRRTRNPSRPSGTKRHTRRPGTPNTEAPGRGVNADASNRHVEHQLV